MSEPNGDKRSVATDALETLGSIIGEGEKRDAIHLAVEPAVAAHPLRPGDDVGFVDGGVGICQNPVGIVDPFLKSPVLTGQRFWLVVYPRQITSLRHVWEHPKFPLSLDVTVPVVAGISKEVATQWMRDFADRYHITYQQAIQAGHDWVEQGGYFTINDSSSLRDDMYEDTIRLAFWKHFEIITGVKVSGQDREGTVFSCSC